MMYGKVRMEHKILYSGGWDLHCVVWEGEKNAHVTTIGLGLYDRLLYMYFRNRKIRKSEKINPWIEHRFVDFVSRNYKN